MAAAVSHARLSMVWVKSRSGKGIFDLVVLAAPSEMNRPAF